MLYTPGNDFGWYLDNWGTNYTGSVAGTSVNAHTTNANQKGTAVSVWAGSSVLYDVYQINLWFFAPGVAATRFLADLVVDPAGGSSWSVLIANLGVNTPSFGMVGCSYHFPVFIKAGTSIGVQQQCSTANTPIRVGIVLVGKPSNPELVTVGNVVQTIGAVTASTEGTAMTPGTNAMGSYSASLGTLTRPCWYWQCGILINDASQTAQIFGTNVEFGDASNKLLAGQAWQHVEPGTTEAAAKYAFPLSGIPVRNAPAGSNVYVRSWANQTPDSLVSAIVYAVS